MFMFETGDQRTDLLKGLTACWFEAAASTIMGTVSLWPATELLKTRFGSWRRSGCVGSMHLRRARNNAIAPVVPKSREMYSVAVNERAPGVSSLLDHN